MKKMFLITIIILFPSLVASAHGGVEKTVGSTKVILDQDPLSPLVGEKVQTTFVFLDTKTNQPLSNLDLQAHLIDTFYSDASKDKEIFSKDLKTDANGSASLEYTFQKANYFDFDLDFKDSQGEQETGFLLQVRNKNVPKYNQLAASLILGMIIGLAINKIIEEFIHR